MSLYAGDVQTQALDQEEGKEEPCLPPGQELSDRATACRCFGIEREGDDPRPEIGIPVHLVGKGVMGIVLGNPPPKAHSGQEVRHAEPHDPVGPAGSKNLLMSGIVAEKDHLGEHQGQDDGDSQRGPRVADEEKRSPRASEAEDGQSDLDRICPWSPGQQPGRAHLLGQRPVVVERSVEDGRRSGSRDADGFQWAGTPEAICADRHIHGKRSL